MDSPGQRNLDFSMFKNFAVTEAVKIQFRAEAFNVTNTPYFGQPNNLGFVSRIRSRRMRRASARSAVCAPRCA